MRYAMVFAAVWLMSSLALAQAPAAPPAAAAAEGPTEVVQTAAQRNALGAGQGSRCLSQGSCQGG